MAEYPAYKVAAVQAAPVQLDLDATVAKACAFIDEAGAAGAKLVAFPEAYIPGYPWWIWMQDPMTAMPHYIDLVKNAVEIPSKAVQSLSEAARRNKTYVCISVTEKDGASIYLTQLWFGPNGDLMGKHRKMKATGAEMTIWGDGDTSMMPVFDTEIGRLGGLQCWEHYIPANVATMAEKNEQVHVSSWPIGMPDPHASFADEQCATGARYYAVSNACYVLCASQIWTKEMEDRLCTPEQRGIMGMGHGFTQIISPTGFVLAKMEHDEEGICYADIDLTQIIPAKYLIDTAGHYSTPGTMQLYVDATEHKAVHIMGDADQEVMPYEEIQFAEGE